MRRGSLFRRNLFFESLIFSRSFMMHIERSDFEELKSIREEMQTLKARISTIEASLESLIGQKHHDGEKKSVAEEADIDINFGMHTDESIEFRVGEYGMAWLGNIVLLFGISFLIQYLQNSGYQILSILIGFISVAGIYAGSFYTRTSFSYLSKLFAFNGHLLLFYTAVRLHFIHTEPLIKNQTLGFFILAIVLTVLFRLAYIRKSQLMTGMVLIMILSSGIISNSTQIMSAMTCIAALLAVVLYYKYGWLKLVFIFIFLIYLSHLNWLLNNPLLGNDPGFIKSPGNAYLYFIASGFIFSSLALIPKKEHISSDFIITSLIFNGLGFSSIMALIIITYLSKSYVPVFSAIAVLCLLYSFILQSRSFLKITASMYALYGFLAMSVAFYGILLFPKAYMLLSLQSLFVVSMALWFRSRFIVVMNTILFMAILIVYLATPGNHNPTNFSFMLVALITARFINWKKERLNIKTEHIRNLYLFFGFVMTLIAFYHAVPVSLITVSWISAALLFFVIGRLINNIKYRWLAIAIILASAVKLIFIDLSNIDIGFRVLVFLLMAIISISVSILYTKYLVKRRNRDEL